MLNSGSLRVSSEHGYPGIREVLEMEISGVHPRGRRPVHGVVGVTA